MEAEEMLKTYPELIESYKKLNNPTKGFSIAKNSKILPNTYQSLIDNCLEENHSNYCIIILFN